MIESHSHLTEDDRHTLADGSMTDDRARELDAHLQHCDGCAADVARIKTLMARIRGTPAPVPDPMLDNVWPSIRSRIEDSKVAALGAAPAPRPVGVVRWPWWAAGLAAAAVVAAVIARLPRGAPVPPTPVATAETTAVIFAVADSARSYEQEARILLNDLEIRRAVMRPETVASLDRDLRVIDQAIDELKVAIATDPRNPALRQLLAASYRQKVDVLRRAGNAS